MSILKLKAAFSSSHMAASSHLKSMPFKSLPSLPFLGKRLEPIRLTRSVNIAAPETMCNSTTIQQTMARLQTKFLPTLPSLKGSYSEGRRGFHRTTLSEFANTKWSRHLLQVLRSDASNDHVESENSELFLNFSGELRAGFVSYLHKALTQAGYSTFIDKFMKRGVNIDEELLKAIRNAKLSVVLISPGYASSQSCLDELIAILYERRFGHKVLPVFFHVNPDDVGSLTGNFGAAFDGLVLHLTDGTDNMIIRVHFWKKALKEVTGISGLVLRQHQCESEFIDQIVAEVNQLLNPPLPLRIASWAASFYAWLQLMASYCTKD